MATELTIPSSKADQLGKGCKLFIAQTKDSICPVNLITKYMAVRPKGNGQSFKQFDTSPLTRYQFVSVLNKILKLIGLPKSTYKSHSFRIGAASDSFNMGISELEIKRKGRWNSEVYKRYIRN